MNVGPGGAALNLGIPGTGLSFRHPLASSERSAHSSPGTAGGLLEPVSAATGTAIESAPASEISSEGLSALRKLIVEVRRERLTIASAIPDAESAVEKAQDRLRTARNWFWRLFLKKRIPELQAAVEARTAELAALRERLEGTFVDADTNADAPTLARYERLADAFVELCHAQRIWDVTSSQANDRVRTRSLASTSVRRKQVAFSVSEQDPVLQTSSRILHLQNANGADLAVYAGFLLLESRSDLALIDLREVDVAFSTSSFTETERVPTDSQVVDQTWAKVNKDGSPDRRFRDNYQIQVAQYAELVLTSPTGLNEAYMVSNVEAARQFAHHFREYKTALAALGEQQPETPDDTATASLASAPVEPRKFGSVAYLDAQAAADIDEAAQTMIEFARRLQTDLQALNGTAPGVHGWSQFVAEISEVPSSVHSYFVRSPSARAVEPAATREVTKLLKSVLDQVQSGLAAHLAAQPSQDADFAELMAKVRSAAAALPILN